MFDVKMPKRTIVQCGFVIGSVVLFSWLNVRPLGLVFLALFCFWYYKTRCNLRIVPPPELQKKYNNIIRRISVWRQNYPTMFCLITSGCLGALAILGHLISGSTVVLAGLVVAALLSTKYNFKLVQIEHKDFDWSHKLNHDQDLDDEFIPEVSESNLFVLERASNLATISSPTDDAEEEEKSNEIPSDLLIPDSIPEVDENSTDGENEDLVPASKSETNKKGQQDNYHSISKNSDAIEFKKAHFKRDSSLSSTSSSSEESLSKGLKFPEYTAVDGSNKQTQSAGIIPQNQEASDLVALAVKSQTQAIIANSTKLIPNLMSGIMQWSMGNTPSNYELEKSPDTALAGRRVVTALDSSDESDFEILENDDFK